MTSHALKSFWKCYDKLPAHIQKLADKQFALFKATPGHPSLGFAKRAESTLSRLAAVTVPWFVSGLVTTIGSRLARMKIITSSSSEGLPYLPDEAELTLSPKDESAAADNTQQTTTCHAVLSRRSFSEGGSLVQRRTCHAGALCKGGSTLAMRAT